jgi:hypothetical protein
MTEHNDPLLLDHEADGIREFDNKLPRWWVWLFYLTIIFAIGYFGYYHVYGNIRPDKVKLSADEYKSEMAIGNLIKSNSMAKFEADIAALQPSKDPDVLARGKKTFGTLCAVSPPGRRRVGRAEPHGRLLDSRQQFLRQCEDHLERRAGKGDDHLEEHAEAERDLRCSQLYLHPARHAPAQPQATREPGPGQEGP